jgi:hypothetical protein
MTHTIQAVRLSSSLKYACLACTMGDPNRVDCERVAEVMGRPKGVCTASMDAEAFERQIIEGRMKKRRQ